MSIMYLGMTAGLLAISVATEMIIIAKIPFLRNLLMRHALTSLAFSLALSWLIGVTFGAAGMIIMFAALGSSILSWFIYRAMDGAYLAFNGVKNIIAVHQEG